MAPPVYAQAGCDGRVSSEFTESAPAADITAWIDAGMDPHSISGGCATALHAAVALTEDTAVVTALLQGAADANARDPYGTPVLHPAAAPTPNLKVIASLIATNADIDARIANGRLYANRGRGDRSRRPRRQKPCARSMCWSENRGTGSWTRWTAREGSQRACSKADHTRRKFSKSCRSHNRTNT